MSETGIDIEAAIQGIKDGRLIAYPAAKLTEQAEKIQQRDDSIKLYKATLVQNGLDMTGMRDENQRLKELLNEETMFEKIWEATKHWDLDNGRPIEGTDIRGYAGMTGDDVRVIIKAIKAAQPQGGSDE